MKKIIKIALAAAVSVMLVLLLSGCMTTTADELYSLPQLSERYLQLQGLIDQILDSGAEYAAPTSGSNRQTIQIEDINGDGVTEAVAFFNFLGSDKPLKIYIFSQNSEGLYQEAAVIEGEGSGIDSINYMDMDGDGVKEIAVGWKIVSGMNILSVYSVKGYQPSQIVNTDYTEYMVCDMDRDGRSDIVSLRLSTSELTCEATLYTLADDGEVVNTSTHLSSGVETLLRVRGTTLSNNRYAVFVESRVSAGIITDILVARNGKLQNITMDEMSGVSAETMRSYEVYCRDVNGDDILDVPVPVAMPSLTEGTTYYMIKWYTYLSSGQSRHISTTYNNYSDGWYLVLPEEWIGRVAVRRVDGVTGERTVIFSKVDENGKNAEDFLVMYTLTGENREERASYGDRFVLLEEEESVYAALIIANEQSLGLPVSPEIIKSNFRIIYSEWITGET